MEPGHAPMDVVTIATLILAIILDVQNSVILSLQGDQDGTADPDKQDFEPTYRPTVDTVVLLSNTLYNYRLSIPTNFLAKDVAYWVKPQSTTWFSKFLIEQYDNRRWLSMFRMTKASVFSMVDLLKPKIEKRNTKYRLAIPVLIRVACTLFKLTHGANLTICSEMFAIGQSIVCKLLRDVVYAINNTLKQEISWPQGERLRDTQLKFAKICSLPAVVGAIDGTHISISKPTVGVADYFYFKSGGYTVNCQAVVDSEKRFLDLYVGMPGSTNDSCMLRRSSLHYLASHGMLFDEGSSNDGQSPFLIGDSGYPLLLWLMVPHKGGRRLSISKSLFNKKLRKGRCVVENAFGILKQTFRELRDKSDVSISFIPDVIICCGILHNILLCQSHQEVEELLHVLQVENCAQSQMAHALDDEGEQFADEECDFYDDVNVTENLGLHHGDMQHDDDDKYLRGITRRNELGIYLSTRR